MFTVEYKYIYTYVSCSRYIGLIKFSIKVIKVYFFFILATKPMQDGWGGGGGGEDLNLTGSQWDTEDGDMWNSAAPQESNSSCNSWGNASKKVPVKVCKQLANTVILPSFVCIFEN